MHRLVLGRTLGAWRSLAVVLVCGLAPLQLSSAGFTRAQPTGGLYDYPLTALNGSVSAEVSVPMPRCRQICLSRSGCAGYDHSSAGICRIFATVGGARQSNDYNASTRALIPNYRDPANLPPPSAPEPEPPGFAEVPPVEEVEEPPAVTIFRRFRNRDLTRDAADSFGAQSVDECEARCQDAGSWCVAYTFDDWNSRCFLKDGSGQLLVNARGTTGVSTELGTPPQSGATVYFERFNGNAFPGSGFDSLSSNSRDACERACDRNGQCIAYSFVKSRRNCILFDRAREYSSRSGVMSGSKRQD